VISFCLLTCFLDICINLKIKFKKKAPVKHIKNSILNRTIKKFFQKNYSFNRYVSDKFQIFTIIFKICKKEF